jgi:microsomal epoxide hydrolase
MSVLPPTGSFLSNWPCAAPPCSRRQFLERAAASAMASAGSLRVRAQTPVSLEFTQTRVQTTDGVSLRLLQRYRLRVDGARPCTLVFLPGWCMPADMWRLQLEAALPTWHAIAIDPRGQGGSEVPAGGYTAERRADDLHDVLNTLSEPVILVAWSLGVLESLEYVARHGTGKLQALVLVDNSIGEPPAPAGGGHFTEELRRHRDAALEHFVRGMFAKPPAPPMIQTALDSARRMPLGASLALLAYPFPREHWRQIVHQVDVPLVYAVTERFRAQAAALARARPASTIEIFDGAGHALFVDEAARFNDMLRQVALKSATG